MQFWVENGQIIAYFRVGALSSGKSWIHHWYVPLYLSWNKPTCYFKPCICLYCTTPTDRVIPWSIYFIFGDHFLLDLSKGMNTPRCQAVCQLVNSFSLFLFRSNLLLSLSVTSLCNIVPLRSLNLSDSEGYPSANCKSGFSESLCLDGFILYYLPNCLFGFSNRKTVSTIGPRPTCGPKESKSQP